MIFQKLGLNEQLLKALEHLNYKQPTDIQAKAIPVVLQGRDLLASAQTGTGKTASFALPLLHLLSNKQRASANQTKALILAPTRELALQIHDNIVEYGQFLRLRTSVVYGGVKINPQMMRLRGGTEILIATPGRLLDLMHQRAIRFDQLEYLVLDEADRMLDMGFIHDIKRIMQALPRNRQTMLFSATFPTEIRELCQKFLNQPIEVSVNPPNQTATTVKHMLHPVDKARKTALLSHLIRDKQWPQALIFSKTKHGANKLVKKLAEDGIVSMAIHGDKTQAQRVKALQEFKSGRIRYLIATDIAARGIDIDDLPIVVNFDLPQVAEDYVHRIGRTGRAGKVGHAISLVSADEFLCLKQIEKLTKKQIVREEIEGFEATHILPSSSNPNAVKRKTQSHWEKSRNQQRARQSQESQKKTFKPRSKQA
jgi:ATP-dependent RNA helicase RhlE